MTGRRVLQAVVMLMVVSACGADVVGPGIPECGDVGPLEPVESVTIVQLQAVPDAAWGPCIEELRVGWKYVPQFAESGRAVFWLDSDRVGDRFVEVELTAACDTTDMTPGPSPMVGIDMMMRVDEEPEDVMIAVVGVAPRHLGDARALVTRLIGRRAEGRTLMPYVDESGGPAAQRIQRLVQEVGTVLVLDDEQVASDTVELRRFRHRPELGLTLDEVVDEIADDLPKPRLRAEFVYTFAGGCISYRFDAEGDGVASVISDVRDALGFYPLGELREVARQIGLDV